MENKWESMRDIAQLDLQALKKLKSLMGIRGGDAVAWVLL